MTQHTLKPKKLAAERGDKAKRGRSISIEFKQDFESIRIYINGLIHLFLLKKTFMGFTAYLQNGCYYIEFCTTGKRILLIHENRETWAVILKTLNDNL
jgi:hypothetical protein